MQNDPELNGKYLGSISADFVKVAENLKEASYQIRSRKFSEYPIFILAKEEVPLGQMLISKVDLTELEWNYKVTYIDEFVQRNIIEAEKKQQFVDAYKDPDEFCCLFIIDNEFQNFLFIPYPID